MVLFSWAYFSFVDRHFVYAIDHSNVLRHLLFSGSVGVFWSIPPEVQFYAFFILLWFSAGSWRRSRIWPSALALASIVGMYAISSKMPGTTLPTKLSFFLLGSLAGHASSEIQNRGKTIDFAGWLQLPLLALVIAINIYRLMPPEDAEKIYGSDVYALICAVMIFGFSFPNKLGDAVFGNRFMRTLGAWSFAIYLLHEPCLYWSKEMQDSFHWPRFATLLFGIAATGLLSYVAHHFYEKPVQRAIRAISQSLLERRKEPRGKTLDMAS